MGITGRWSLRQIQLSFEQHVSGLGIVFLLTNLTHSKLLANEQLPAVDGFLVQTLG